MLIVLVAACFAWIGVLSLAAVTFLGTAASTGWIIAGALLLALVIWLVVMAREIRQATELPDYFERIERSLHAGDRVAYSRPFHKIGTLPTKRTATRTVIGSRGMTAGNFDGIRPRSVRPRQDRPRTTGWT